MSVYMNPQGINQYSGAFQSSFIQTANKMGYEVKVDYSVEPGRLPTASAASGLVTSTPGDYEFRIALFAELPGHVIHINSKPRFRFVSQEVPSQRAP